MSFALFSVNWKFLDWWPSLGWSLFRPSDAWSVRRVAVQPFRGARSRAIFLDLGVEKCVFQHKKRKFVGCEKSRKSGPMHPSGGARATTQSWKVYRTRCSLPRQFLNAIPSVCPSVRLFPHFLFPRWILLKLHRFKALQKLCNSVKFQILKRSAGLKMAKSRFSQKISTGPRGYPWTIWNFLKNSLSNFFECLHDLFWIFKKS